MRPKAPLVATLEIGDKAYRTTLQYMSRKTITMHVSGLELFVKVPLNANPTLVYQWILSKQAWIAKRNALVERMKLDENETWYLGRKTRITSGEQTSISSNGITLKRGASFDAAMRRHAIIIVNGIFDAAAHELGYGPKELKFRTMARSWGRCTSKGTITLNTHLISCDPRFIRYVCIHELVHLKYLNHSPLFWKVVRRYVPDLTAVKKLSIPINKQDLLAL
jgi:predicted metal-dependent hydrolase